jgi:hypothetical protein
MVAAEWARQATTTQTQSRLRLRRNKRALRGANLRMLDAARIRLKHDPEKWIPVFRLREASLVASPSVRRFGGRSQVGKDHAQTTS